MPRALKVFRTAIGFHDAYVAATSRKAALEAWGSATDLFAVGLAEQVTDEALIREPLAYPGTVIKRVRGTPAEHLEAAKPLPPTKRRVVEDVVERRTSPRPAARKPKPRPSRAEIEAAEAAMEPLLARQKSETDDLDRREAELRREREKLRTAHEKERQEADDAVTLARQSHEDAIKRWLAEQERDGGQ